MEFAWQVSDKSDFDGDDPLFLASVKAIENVTESVKQLDNIDNRILIQLFKMTQWQNMRDVVAHQFWEFDVDVIWNTARNDLLELHKLLGNLNIKDDPHDDLRRLRLSFSVNDTYSSRKDQNFQSL